MHLLWSSCHILVWKNHAHSEVQTVHSFLVTLLLMQTHLFVPFVEVLDLHRIWHKMRLPFGLQYLQLAFGYFTFDWFAADRSYTTRLEITHPNKIISVKSFRPIEQVMLGGNQNCPQNWETCTKFLGFFIWSSPFDHVSILGICSFTQCLLFHQNLCDLPRFSI